MLSGTIPRNISLITTAQDVGRSSSGTGGPSLGLRKLRTRVYTIYMLASRNPGPKADAYRSATETPSTGPMTISITEGGTRIPSVPPAAIEPAARRAS
jgi:hypothetical protein